MTGMLWNFVFFIIALGTLVTVHEFGHFWVARRCGVKVEKFSIGFGHSLWSRVAKDGTEYSVSLIPLGGYVKMLDTRVEDVPDALLGQAFDKKPLWQRTAVVAAGPVFNFLLALMVYWCVFIIGTPSVKPVVGEVAPNSIVAEAGIEPGMELKAISGIKTSNWQSVSMQILAHIGDPSMTMTVSIPGEINTEETKQLDLSTWQFDPERDSPLASLGVSPFWPEVRQVVKQVTPDGAADKAGFMSGDRIVAIDGQTMSSWQDIVSVIQQSANKTLAVDIVRQGQPLSLSLSPEQKMRDDQALGFAGIAPEVDEWPAEYRFDLQYGPVEAVSKAFEKTGQVIQLTFTMLKKLVVGDVGLNNLSGPISIAKGAGMSAEVGLVYFLGFVALISVNLGIMNLVPLPMLDGGHLLFFAIEAVIRRPIPEKIQEVGYKIGGAVVFSLMALALFNDFARL